MPNRSSLPEAFVADMRETLGAEQAEQLIDALTNTEPVTSIRINPRKMAANLPLQRVPWCETGYYIDDRPPFTFDPLFHGGAYYVQESSSMFIEKILRQHYKDTALHYLPADEMNYVADEMNYNADEMNYVAGAITSAENFARVALDLCAAPGGKSTLLRSILPDDTLLVCNEPMPKRAQVLAENMTKWGHPNVMVTQSMPDAFTGLHEVFDLILTDVPCSGEGMFRKDDEAIAEWSVENVDMCWRRQRDILEAIWPTLKPGGLLIYSTCTFNHYEDEDNVEWIARELGADVLPIDIDPSWNITPGRPSADGNALGYHFYPHLTRGEGFFAAALRKHTNPLTDETGTASLSQQPTVASNSSAPNQSLDRLKRRLRLMTRVILDGIEQPSADTPCYDVDYNTAIQYLRGEVLRLPTDTPRGIITITYKNLPLGQAKNIGSRANNLYPQAWRIKSTHIKPFTITDI